MNINDLLTFNKFSESEQKLSELFKLEIYPKNEIIENLLIKEVNESDFTLDQIKNEFSENLKAVFTFSRKWYEDCNYTDYGEEGNQQEPNEENVTVGISQGFLISYSLFYLYMKSKPELLSAYLKKRRIPHSGKVYLDIQRVYKTTKRK